MSMIGSPSRLSDPIVAIESVVTSGRTSFDSSSATSICGAGELDGRDAPTSLPLSRTTAPVFSPWTSSNRALSG